jgi:hypothetical protein
MNTRTTLPIVMFAERGYRVLLRLYPADHRAEYGHWMAQAFRDQCYEDGNRACRERRSLTPSGPTVQPSFLRSFR